MDVKVGILADGVASLMESRRLARSEQSSSSSSSAAAAGCTGSGGGALVEAAGVSTSIDSLMVVLLDILDDFCRRWKGTRTGHRRAKKGMENPTERAVDGPLSGQFRTTRQSKKNSAKNLTHHNERSRRMSSFRH